MVSPDELEKLFANGLPSWIEKPVEEKKPVQEIPTPAIPLQKAPGIEITGHASILANLGIDSTARMYAFFKPSTGVAPSQEGNPFAAAITDHAADDMFPLGKHPKVHSKSVAKGMWFVRGMLPLGTVVKVFVGRTNDPAYGMYYLIVDDYAPEVNVMHPESNLFIQGKLREVTSEMYAELGLKRLPSRSNGLFLRTVEV